MASRAFTSAVLVLAACAAYVIWASRTPPFAFAYMDPADVARLVPPGTRSLALVAHHADAPRLCPNLAEYVRQLSLEFERVVLLTDATTLDAGGLPAGCVVARVPNKGLDFGKWAHVLHRLPPRPSLRRLGLFNDSVFVAAPLVQWFEAARARGWDFWGMTGSSEVEPHVQSYFLVADSPAAVRHMLRFFSGKRMDHVTLPTYSKFDLVREFELGLSRHMARAHPLRAWFDGEDMPDAACPNPSLCSWDLLLRLGCPVLKKFRRRVPGGEDAVAALPPSFRATIADPDARVFDGD